MKKQNKKQSLQTETATYIVQQAEVQKEYLTKLNKLNDEIDDYKQEILSEPVLDSGKQRKYKMLVEMASKQGYLISLALNAIGRQQDLEIKIAELEMQLERLLRGVDNVQTIGALKSSTKN